jgi:uncharacterized membrane protein
MLVVTFAAIAAAALNVGLHGEPAALRVVLAIPLLLAPGYAVVFALFGSGSVRLTERVVLVGAFSLSIVVFVGLALDAFPGGLNRRSWSVALALVTVVAATCAVGLRRGSPPTSRPVWHVSLPLVLVAILGLLIVLATLGLAKQGSTASHRQDTFTELWALPVRRAGKIIAIRFGVTNEEGRPASYRLVARSAAGAALYRTPWFRLAAKGSRTGRVRLAATPGGGAVVVDLFLGGKDPGRVYRSAKVSLSG